MKLVWAREPLPATGPTLFLAGPTPRSDRPVPSWRPAALEVIDRRWTGPLTVLTPESRDGVLAEDYDDQFAWETAARAMATVILFWIPRDLRALPGFTTNVEFGHDVAGGRVVLGCPPDCPDPRRNKYLIHLARHYGVPVCETLEDTVGTALELVAGKTSEPGGFSEP
ncbi:nucleoside 2-deoxyribosyltransferase domain-containing protein [Amycolatopsis magusensis]|uniref:nucleoside 2-deoxyribosyltransferase domain-containing protein n=1 Tax=Amycolatopsis magusensis TaxID=882444 RepID=UPI003C2F44DB